ncbi:patatin-like phospholipase family protein [Nocardioides sp. GXQ0305]|uniref:patatin-like phospholipase family protein n=1 Tax=Nocardioides sp. GXQ0305 TaxID=3423912 RepID=UPI003D7CD76F
MTQDRPVKVLSIDGGGIRGYLPALFLAELEQRSGRPISTMFDLVVGTSTGAIIGIGLATGKSAVELSEFYPTYGRRIFGGTDERTELQKRLFGSGADIWESLDKAARTVGGPFGGNPSMGGNARHEADGLESVLAEVLGETKLSELDTELAVTTFDRLTSLPVVLSTRDARVDPAFDLPLRTAARATSAAPTFFPPLVIEWAGKEREFVDGGVWANNPAGVAVSESIALTSERKLVGSSVLLVSLGTGVVPGGSILDGNGSWLGAAKDLAGLATSVWAGEVLARRALGNTKFRRFQVVDPRVAGAMNDPSSQRLDVLREAAEKMIQRESEAMNALVAELTV